MPFAGLCVFPGSGLSKANIFHDILFIHTFCDYENLPSPVDIPQSQMKSSSTWWKVRSQSLCESFWSHMQSRGGCHSDMSYLRNEDVLSFASFITSELMNLGVCCTHLFSPCWSAIRYMFKESHYSQNFYLCCHLQGPSPCALSFNPLVHLLTECNWLFFLTVCIRHITVRLVTVRNIARI